MLRKVQDYSNGNYLQIQSLNALILWFERLNFAFYALIIKSVTNRKCRYLKGRGERKSSQLT